MTSVANPPWWLILAWFAFLFGSPGMIVAFVVYGFAPRLGIRGVRDWTSLPRFIVVGIIISFGYGLSAATGFLFEVPLPSMPYINAILFGYVYVAGILRIASIKGVFDKLEPLAWVKVVGVVGTLSWVAWAVALFLSN